MNDATLIRKLDTLESFSSFSPESVRRFGKALRELEPWEAARINPFAFGAERGFDSAEAVELFVHGAKIGLFDFVWNLICPHCGAIVMSRDSVNTIETVAHCAVCAVEVESSLDDQIEVAFALNPSVSGLDLDPFGSVEDYWRSVRSPNFRHAEEVRPLVDEAVVRVALLAPDHLLRVDIDAEPGRSYSLVSVERHVAARLPAKLPGEGMREVAFDLLPTGIHPAEAAIAPGRVAVTLRNLCKQHVGVALLRDDERIGRLITDHPPTMLPFLTGKLLINNQSFRDLFRVQHLVPNLRLPLRSLTILFTDLKGSTELYDKTGDAYAYGLVQEHYAELTKAVREQAGAVIKTMGDAIMASFSRPIDAVRAAVAMVERIEALNERWRRDGHELGLKVGLHEGPALAVNADDRLDYFGQTVNIAARVQALAQAGEIWHTTDVLRAEGVEAFLRSKRYVEQPHSVTLKGVGRQVRVHQWRPAAAESAEP